MYTLASAPAPTIPAYSSAAVTTGSIIFLALLTCAIAASIFARHHRSERPKTTGRVRKDHRMRSVPHSRNGEGAVVMAATVMLFAAAAAIVAVSVTDRPTAALVLIVLAVAAGAMLGVIGLVRELRSRHAAEELERETVEAWFDAPNLADFPTQGLDEMQPGIGRAERPRLQTAWLLAAHGHDAAWLTGHLGLSSDVARLLADSAQRSSTPPRS